MPGIPALQLRGFAELDRARLVSRLKGKNVPTYGSNSAAKSKTGKAYEAETKTKLNDFELLSCSYYSAAKSALQNGLIPEF